MVAARRYQAGFTLTETMVVVVILGVLAAVSTPLLTRDNKARKGRGWASLVAQTLQKARFQAMGDRANVEVRLYRTHVDTCREESTGSPPPCTLLSSVTTPGENVDTSRETIAIWDASSPSASNPSEQNPTMPKTITFTSLGSTLNNTNWWIYVRNELLPAKHPDAGFLIRLGGLTGYVSTSYNWVPPQ